MKVRKMRDERWERWEKKIKIVKSKFWNFLKIQLISFKIKIIKNDLFTNYIPINYSKNSTKMFKSSYITKINK